jgi:sRNA-binding regulator protein Hfq
MNLTNEDRHKVVHEYFSDMIQEKIEEISKGVLPKEKPVSDAPKTFFVNPYDFYASSQGQWRERPSQVTWETLKAISKKSPIISSIIKTRTGQVGTFSAPISLMELCGNSTIGYTFIPLDKDKKISKSEERMIKELEQFIWNCGVDAENHKFNRDNFDIWLKKITRDSLVYDAACSEILPTRRGSIYEFHAIDAATVRQASVIDNKVHNDAEEENPVYVQVLNGQVVAEYMHDEIMYGVRNPTTDIRNCGYGESEIELLISVVTSLMNAMTHNAMFFKNGAAIKGLLNIKQTGPLGEVANQQLEAFKRAFHAMCNGTSNAWRTPIVSSEGVEWVNMGGTNREFEFQKYLDWLVKLTCSIYQIDPSEIGFWMTAGNSDRAPMFESNQEAKLKMSKDKGLRPLLTAIARWVNYYIVSKVAPGFYFTFVGMDAKSEGEILEARLKELKGYKMLDEIREEAGLKPLGDEKGGDLILDPTYVQALQQRAMLKMQQDQMAQGQDQGGEEWAPPEGGDQDQQSQDENQQDQGEDQQGEAQQGDENQKFWQQMQGGEDQEGGQEDDQGEQPWHKYLQSPDEQGEEQGQKKEKPLKKSLAIEDFSDDKLIEIYLEG